MRQQVLENLGWKIHRIWSRDWIEDRNREIEKILIKVKESCKEEARNPSIQINHSSDQINSSEQKVYESVSPEVPILQATRTQGSTHSQLPPGTQPYRCAHITVPYRGVEGFRRTNRYQMHEILRYIVENEGPIAEKELKRRVANAYGITRIGSNIDNILITSIYSAVQNGVFQRRGVFLWKKGDKTVNVRVPHRGDGSRTIEEISPEEIQEGIYICVKSALSIDTEDLIKQTAKLFGLKANAMVSIYIEKNLSMMIQSNRLEWRGDKIRLPQ